MLVTATLHCTRSGFKVQRPIIDILIVTDGEVPLSSSDGSSSLVMTTHPIQAAVGLVLGGSYVQHLQVEGCTEEQQEAFVLRRPVDFFEDDRAADRLHVSVDQLYEALGV